MNVFERIAEMGLPLLGAALPIPGGAALGAALAKKIGSKSSAPTDILEALQASTQAQRQAAEFQDKHEQALMTAAMQFEADQVKAQAGVVTAEATGESWLQRNWRPITMLSFVGLLFLYWFGVQPANVSEGRRLVECDGGLLHG